MKPQHGWGWKVPLEVTWSRPQAGPPRDAQDHVQTVFKYFQGRASHSIPGRPVTVLGHPHSEEVFLDVQREPLVFLFVPGATGPISGHH